MTRSESVKSGRLEAFERLPVGSETLETPKGPRRDGRLRFEPLELAVEEEREGA